MSCNIRLKKIWYFGLQYEKDFISWLKLEKSAKSRHFAATNDIIHVLKILSWEFSWRTTRSYSTSVLFTSEASYVDNCPYIFIAYLRQGEKRKRNSSLNNWMKEDVKSSTIVYIIKNKNGILMEYYLFKIFGNNMFLFRSMRKCNYFFCNIFQKIHHSL